MGSELASLPLSASALFTLKGLVEDKELEELRSLTGECLAKAPRLTIHSSDDGLGTDLGEMYEPCGRDEALADSQVVEALRPIVDRANERLTNWFERFQIDEWFIFRYGRGQFIIPHADGTGHSPEERADHVQLAALSLVLQQADAGGEFYVQTESCEDDWSHGVRTGLDPTSSRYDRTTHPRWVLKGIEAGDAIVFGSEVVHGTESVVSGAAWKMIGFITSAKG